MFLAGLVCVSSVQWVHPAGLVTEDTVREVQQKLAAHEWAREVYETRKRALGKWVDAPDEQLRAVFPTVCGNVYHNFSDPADLTRLAFDPFNPFEFRSADGQRTYAPDTDPGVYEPGDRYHGTMYDGWVCLFYLTAASVAADLALAGRVDNDPRYTQRSIDLLLLFANTVHNLPTDRADQTQFARILTYHREGDNKILYDLAVAYELVRHAMTPDECRLVEDDFIRRFLDDIMLEPYYTYDHNNVYQWHRTIVQAALSLERADLIDWSFGYGEFAADRLPEHRSMARIAATHFNEDGAFWELCSGYHLYPLFHFCEFAVISRNLSRMDPVRFPPERYDYTRYDSPGGRAIKDALEWFMSLAMPDRTVTVIGDSTVPRAGMEHYFVTAEAGYRYFDVRGVGDYDALRAGSRSWAGLVLGAPEIQQRYTPFTSSYLSSGWLSLRSAWDGNRVWAGLNAMLPGGGHQHADRLTLTLYSHGTLLALEKATPYNELFLRHLGTYTQAHNTVVVDQTTQKQGEALEGEEIPDVAHFFAGPTVQFAQVHGDNIYPQTERYRRSAALIEDVTVDRFEVAGGHTHDWLVNHAGGPPELSLPVAASTFEPAEWLTNGTSNVRHAETNETWSARWTAGGVTSRLTMLGAPATHVYALETYPVDNAVITPDHPPCQTLCVRRHDNAPFLAVWDAWRAAPNLTAIEPAQANTAGIKLTTRSAQYYLVYGPGCARRTDATTMPPPARVRTRNPPPSPAASP
jgi:hypothetical protein